MNMTSYTYSILICLGSGSNFVKPGLQKYRFRLSSLFVKLQINIFPRISDPFYKVTYYIKWVTTS